MCHFNVELVTLSSASGGKIVHQHEPSNPLGINRFIVDNNIPSKSNRDDWVSSLVSGLAAFGQLFCKMFTGFFEAYSKALGHHQVGVHGRASRY